METNTENLTIGHRSEQIETVTDSLTAARYGSGLLAVYATPALVALMEKTAICDLAEHLPEGSTTVGARIDVRHLKASPVGERLRCVSTLMEKEGRRLSFHIEAYDESGDTVGTAEHERFVVETQRFMSKFNPKKD